MRKMFPFDDVIMIELGIVGVIQHGSIYASENYNLVTLGVLVFKISSDASI